MARVLALLVFAAFLLPAAAIADDLPANDAKIVEFIGSRAFLDDCRINDMREETKGLSDEWKEYYFERYNKNGSWSWLNFVAPSAGSWKLGDKLGAVVDIIGNATGFMVFYLSTSLFYSFYPWSMYAGLGAILAVDFFSVISGYIYAGGFNSHLEEGLNLYSSIPCSDRTGLIACSGAKNGPSDILHLDLVSFRF